MPCYSVLDAVYVPFEPQGALAELDFTKANERLNKLEAATALNWVKAGEGNIEDGYKSNGENVDVAYGYLGMEISEHSVPAFAVNGIENGLLNIDILETPDGKALMQTMDEMKPLRFSAIVDMGVDNEVLAYTRFYCVLRDKVKGKEIAPAGGGYSKTDSMLLLPGRDFDIRNPMGV